MAPDRGSAPTALSDNVVRILKQRVFAHLVTLMKNGSPQVTPVWVDTDGRYVLVNTAEGRAKLRNIRRDPRVAVSVIDQTDPYGTATQVRGKVVEITTEGADAHIDALAKRYLGKDRYPWRSPGEVRLILKIAPERVMAPS